MCTVGILKNMAVISHVSTSLLPPLTGKTSDDYRDKYTVLSMFCPLSKNFP